MSTVKVNLLPREYEVQARERRVTGLTVVLVLVFVAVLGVVYFLKVGAVDQARAERDAEQAEVSRLTAELAQLEEFRELADRLQARNDLLAFAMANEISWAAMLNDLSLTFPASASLRTLTGQFDDPEEPGAGEIDPGTRVAAMVFSGYSVERLAPGVEIVLIEFDKGRAFFNSFVTSSAVEEIGNAEVQGFDGSVQLDENAFTRRYEAGLPAEVAE